MIADCSLLESSEEESDGVLPETEDLQGDQLPDRVGEDDKRHGVIQEETVAEEKGVL